MTRVSICTGEWLVTWHMAYVWLITPIIRWGSMRSSSPQKEQVMVDEWITHWLFIQRGLSPVWSQKSAQTIWFLTHWLNTPVVFISTSLKSFIRYFNLKAYTWLGVVSCRTRESLASNTSSIVESNRRQNPALSPGHIGTSSIGLPFSFRAIPEPPTTQPEKLQKSSNCLASITSVWQAAQTETVKVVEERGSEVVHHFDPRFPQPITHKHTHLHLHTHTHTDTNTHISSDSWESIYWDCYKNRHGFKRLFPQLQELYCKKEKKNYRISRPL